jgi:hypothetical protein
VARVVDMSTEWDETWKEIAFKLRTLAYDLNTVQSRIISILFDVLYPDDSKKHTLMFMKDIREFVKGILNDVDEIIKLMEKKVS